MAHELARFLHGEVDAANFHHADHVRIGFEILRRHSFVDAARAYSHSLKAIAARAGNPGAYHETITLAFLALIAERGAHFTSFEEFAAANPDLLEKSALTRWYTPERLSSDIARAIFILPDPVRS